jgi:hypothetical protein
MKQKIFLLSLIFLLLFNTSTQCSVVTKVGKEFIEEFVEKLAIKGGKEALEKGTKKSFTETVELLIKKNGDEILKVIDDGGVEFLKSFKIYGDELVEFSIKASPKARKILAQNAEELLPLLRRVGGEALEVEAKCPGLAKSFFKTFGDDTGKALAKIAKPEDIPKLISYAEKADSPATRKLLIEAYKKEGKKVLQRIPVSLVLTSGLTASMIYGTHRLTEPTAKLGKKIDESNTIAEKAVSQFFSYGTFFLLVVTILLLWRFDLLPLARKKNSTTNSETKSEKKKEQ